MILKVGDVVKLNQEVIHKYLSKTTDGDTIYHTFCSFNVFSSFYYIKTVYTKNNRTFYRLNDILLKDFGFSINELLFGFPTIF